MKLPDTFSGSRAAWGALSCWEKLSVLFQERTPW